MEVYGGALLNSWLDRDLGLSGRVARRDGDGATTELVRIDRPLLRVPQLAIHLDREIDQQGLRLNRQAHLTPVWGLGAPEEGAFRADSSRRAERSRQRSPNCTEEAHQPWK